VLFLGEGAALLLADTQTLSPPFATQTVATDGFVHDIAVSATRFACSNDLGVRVYDYDGTPLRTIACPWARDLAFTGPDSLIVNTVGGVLLGATSSLQQPGVLEMICADGLLALRLVDRLRVVRLRDGKRLAEVLTSSARALKFADDGLALEYMDC